MAQFHLGPHGATERPQACSVAPCRFWAGPASSIMGRHSASQLLV